MALGAQAFMNKPLDIDRLLAIMAGIKERSE
jgi:DNA-binding NtrC family response regulator